MAEEEFSTFILSLDIRKRALNRCIPARILKCNEEVCFKSVIAIISHCFSITAVPSKLKIIDQLMHHHVSLNYMQG